MSMKMRTLKKSSSKRAILVEVQTLDTTMEFDIESKALGKELFELVCRTIGLRETWYFGLQYYDSKGFMNWLKMDKRLNDQDVGTTRLKSSLSSSGPSSTTSSNSSVSTTTSSTSGGISNLVNARHHSLYANGTLRGEEPKKPHMTFNFLAKFFPEDVTEELVQEVTQRLFYLQVKQAILNMEIFCPPEASVLLASYAVQAKYGDYDEGSFKPGMLADAEDLLPQRVLDQYQMTPEMWEERIRVWYADHRGMSRDEAELEYLKIAQDLDMYGVNYFSISNKKESLLWLGVTATCLNIYEHDNKLTPKISFPWSEIKHISFDDKKFIIKPVDKSAPPFNFYSDKTRMNKLILELCMGNHDLYMKRRQPDTPELQQMKLQAQEEKQRRLVEKAKLAKEKELREQAEKERSELQQRLIQFQEEARAAQEQLRRSEEYAQLLDEKVRVAEEEAMLLSQKSAEAEAEIQRIKISAIKTEEEKIIVEKKAVEAEMLATSMIEESQLRSKESEALRMQLLKARYAEKEAKDRLMAVLQATTSGHVISSSPQQFVPHNVHSTNSTLNPEVMRPVYVSSGTPEITCNPNNNAVTTPVSLTNYYLNDNNRNNSYQDTQILHHLRASMSPNHVSPALPQIIGQTAPHLPPLPALSFNEPSLTNSAFMSSSLSRLVSPASDILIGVDNDVEKMTRELERERLDCMEKSRNIQNQLMELKSEIQVLKVQDKVTPFDRIHEQNVNRGDTKYSTLKKTKSGTTKARVSFFEAL